MADSVSITTQPTRQRVALNAAASFAVIATGSGAITYQWEKSLDGITFSSMAGKTSATLPVASSQFSDQGYYQCVVTCGTATATSSAVQLSIECIVALITANRKAAIAAMSTATGYSFTPAAVEEERIIKNVNGQYPFLNLLKEIEQLDEEDNISNQTTIRYTITYEDLYNDDNATDDEIVNHFRNVNADIIRAWMLDRTCGGFCEFSKVSEYDDAVVSINGKNLYRSYVQFETQSLIDSSNPFLKG